MLCAERPTTPEPQFSTPVFSTCTCSAVLLQQGSNRMTSADRCGTVAGYGGRIGLSVSQQDTTAEKTDF